MATRAIRLNFSETDLLDPKIRRAARKANTAADRADKAIEKLQKARKLHREREFAANTLRTKQRTNTAVSTEGNSPVKDVQYRARRQAVYSEAARKQSSKLRFSETEIQKPSGSLNNAVNEAGHKLSSSIRSTIQSGNQDDNTGVQSAQFVSDAANQTIYKVNHDSYSRRLKRYANAVHLATKSDAANVDALYQKALKDHPEANSNPLSRWRQKQEIKRQYAIMKAGQGSGSSKAAARTTHGASKYVTNTTERLLQYVKSNSHFLLIILGFAFLVLMISGVVSSCTAISSGIGNSILATSFTAETEDILGVEADYCSKEEALRNRIHQIQSQGDYDEYVLNVDEIGHNPWELAALLTVLKENYKRAEVQTLIQQFFNAQYSLSTNVTTETVTETRPVRVGESLGTVTTSAYCSCRICCGQWSGGPTASGVYPRANHTLAVDARDPFVPMGTKVVMNGIEYTVEDTGNFARYGVQFDVYYDNHQSALQHGHQEWECYLADSNGSNTIDVTVTETKRVCTITLVNHTLRSVIDSMNLSDDQMERFEILLETHGNRPELFQDSIYAATGYSLDDGISGDALTDTQFRNMDYHSEVPGKAR